MTPLQFRIAVAAIGWTQRGLADRLGIHETRTRRWASGRYPVPDNIAEWLERLAATHVRYPEPKGWSNRA